MSKTFKSSTQTNGNRTLSVEKLYGEPCLMIYAEKRMGFLLDPSDAAELMLAIGDTLSVPDMVREDSYEHFMGNAIHYLAKAVKAQERATAEAKDKEELEAEALGLVNEFRKSERYITQISWEEVDPSDQDLWLFMARKVREMRK